MFVCLSDRILEVDDIEQTIQNARNSAFSYSGTLTHIYARNNTYTASRLSCSRLRNSNGFNIKFRLKIVYSRSCFLALSLLLYLSMRCVSIKYTFIQYMHMHQADIIHKSLFYFFFFIFCFFRSQMFFR